MPVPQFKEPSMPSTTNTSKQTNLHPDESFIDQMGSYNNFDDSSSDIEKPHKGKKKKQKIAARGRQAGDQSACCSSGQQCSIF